MNAKQSRFLKLIRAVQNKYREAVYEAIRDQINYFADRYQPGEVPTYLPTKNLIRTLRKIYEDAGYTNGVYVRNQVRRQVKKDMTPAERLRWMINQYYRRFLLDQAVVPITNTTRKQILQVLEKANAEGWGVDKTVRALKETDLTRQRAELIVRTETMKAANAGAMLGAADVGFEMRKQWISAKDNRTRRVPRNQYDHLDMDGVQVGYNEYFMPLSTKSLDLMLYPGDPTASAGNVCNCRCTVAFVPVRDAQGRLIPLNRSSPNPFIQIASQAAQIAITATTIINLIELIEQE